MRPLKLTMNAFGPYAKKETVPFEMMGNSGIYIITGDTGAGKTTVFDGIIFALYGEASGSNRTGNMLHSDFASPDEKPYVELEFELRNQKYKIERNPKYSRPSKRGDNFVTQNEDATLTLPDGNVITGADKVTKECEKLIGLTKNQFTQIAMIAQGDFLRLLLAETKDRTAIFRKIFSTDKYDRLQEEVKSVKNRLDSEYKALSSSILQYLSGAKCKEESLFYGELNVLKQENSIHNLADFEKLIKLIIKEDEADYENSENKRKEADKKAGEISSELSLTEKQKESLKLVEKSIKFLQEDCKKLEEKINSSKEKILKKEQETANIKEYNLQLSSAEMNLVTEQNKLEKLMAEKEAISDALRLLKEKNKLSESLSVKRKEYLNAEKNVLELSRKYNELNNIFLREQAGILAETLAEGEMCPVCGSKEHPEPAKRENSNVNEAEVKKAHKAEQNAREFQAGLSREIGSLNSSLDNCCEMLSYRLNSLFDEVYENIPPEQLVNGKKEENSELIKESEEKCEILKKQANLFKINVETIAENEKLISELKNTAEEIKQKYDLKLLEIKTKEGERNVLLADLPFESKEEEEKNILLLKSQLREAEEASAVQADISKRIFSRIQANNEILKNTGKKSKEYETKIAEYLCYKDLSDTLNGDLSGKQKIKLETYVQMAYFDKIIYEANSRFGKMTDMRYELRRKETAGNLQKQAGLELEIFDNYTGKLRSVKSLSGGESFKASLSMALGLSDVVQQHSGGIRLDAMFIDEGFGGLDSDSLENALEILKELSGGDRLIGIISHVSELREQIDKKIIVKKDVTGSHISVVV
ncbi:MAG: SMC family ATPase [Clostridia bacterium]|nr:SMC family ATPase [Clostridia bacterium]